jgi:ABC-type uncharacterized transport system auxiliary subunit
VIKAIIFGVLILLVSGCMTLPGSDPDISSRYNLTSDSASCSSGGEPLAVRVPRVNVGLDNDRIARRDKTSGEITYLADVRWAEEAGVIVEQQLAHDLECNGFTVISSHHHKLEHAQLVCEVRSFNLVYNSSRDVAEVGLSCVLYGTADETDKQFVARHESPVSEWSASSAVAAMSMAYRAVLEDLLAELL